MPPESPLPTDGSSSAHSRKALWRRLFNETRSRILLLYGLLLLLVTGLSIPLFRYLLFASVDTRVQQDLNQERDKFLTSYREWESAPEQTTEQLKAFVTERFNEVLIEDDNFHLMLIDGKLFYSNPLYLEEPLRPNSQLFQQWIQIEQPTASEYRSGLPDIGKILYTADPIRLEGKRRGTFITAHTSAGERQEALVGVYLLIQIMGVVFFISLLLSWLGAGKLMAPITTLARTARSISDSDLTQRITTPRMNGELAELTHTFNAMMDRIQSAFDSQRSFINDASHELRTPITIIQGHLELLDSDPQSQQETIELVLDELARMGRLVSDLLLIAKSERPNFLQREPIEAWDFTEEIFNKAIALATRNWKLTLETHSVQFTGDRQKLTGALLNLLRNAIQHTHKEHTIALGCRALKNSHDRVQFWVRDTGKGMTLAEQQRAFERFARGPNRRTEGSGLGLAIASAIVQAHNGKIDLESQPNKGSTFRITLSASEPGPSPHV